MALSIRHLDESWPKFSVYNLNQDSNSNRRRLSEDKWAREEREMQMEIKTFFQAKDGSKSHQSGPKGMANLRISDELFYQRNNSAICMLNVKKSSRVSSSKLQK